MGIMGIIVMGGMRVVIMGVVGAAYPIIHIIPIIPIAIKEQ